jgi:ankyrin repeat protein
VAVQKSDVESVLFLLSVNVNVNSRVQDSSQHTPLHLAVITGSEIIVRNLVCLSITTVVYILRCNERCCYSCELTVQLLAGANINDRGPHKDTVLHLAALHDRSAIASILLENKVDFNATDDGGNNGGSLS